MRNAVHLSNSWARTVAASVCLCLVALGAEGAASDAKRGPDLTELSLEELMDVEVTSVSKRKEKQREAAAAVVVITAEDIRRSGATSIPEALRMAPGVHVARINSNRWAVGVRGFNGLYANKLLVLIDGRTVYTPLFSGVYWEAQDLLLEDVARIEVIRGPGATLWGANAVNGVINIITKSARDTVGGLLTVGGGDEECGFGGIRYGAKLGKSTHGRLYLKYFDRDEFVDAAEHRGADGWDALRVGFRVDWGEPEGADRLTLQGDVYDLDAGETLTVPLPFPPMMQTSDEDFDMTGGDLLGRWIHTTPGGSDLALQVYYEQTLRQQAVLEVRRHTFDVDFQHRLEVHPRHELIWGAGYRYTSDDVPGSYALIVDPEDRTDHLFSLFLQDTITLIDERLRLTLGTKIEHNDYTGLEVQPGARLLWTPNERHSLWAAVSRAVQTPSRGHHDMRINIARFPGALLAIFGNDDNEAEELLAYELGYRVRATRRLFLDLAGFYNVYDGLRTSEPGLPFPELVPWPPHLTIPLVHDNRMAGEVFGVELAVDWQVADWWRLRTGYSWLEMRLWLEGSSLDTRSEGTEDQAPHHQFHLLSFMDLPHNLEFDTALYYTDNLSGLDIPSYVRVDARLGWRPTDDLEASLCLQNVFDSHHREFHPIEGVNPTEPERSIYGKLTWRF